MLSGMLVEATQEDNFQESVFFRYAGPKDGAQAIMLGGLCLYFSGRVTSHEIPLLK